MICKQCGAQISDDVKFCPNCGTKIEKEEKESIKEWYFVENNQSNGTYTEQEMKDFYKQGRITNNTYIWKSPMPDWIPYSKSDLYEDAEEVQTEKVEEKQSEESGNQWYYINVNNEQSGPVDESTIVSLIEQRVIGANTYVWQNGMKDWEFVKNTPLSIYLKSNQKPETQAANNPVYIQKKSIGLYLLLSIVTCGLFGLYWLYSIAKDVDTLCKNQSSSMSAGNVLLLSVLTCGIYTIYFFYKACKNLHALHFSNGYVAADDSIITMVLALFGFSIISCCILQSTLNDIQTFAQ